MSWDVEKSLAMNDPPKIPENAFRKTSNAGMSPSVAIDSSMLVSDSESLNESRNKLTVTEIDIPTPSFLKHHLGVRES